MTASLSKVERVVHVDFSRARHDVPHKPPGHGRRSALRVVPLPHRRSGMPESTSIVAVALLIAERTRADTVERDLDAICRLLRQKCAWSDESLAMLRRTVATALDDTERVRPPGAAAD